MASKLYTTIRLLLLTFIALYGILTSVDLVLRIINGNRDFNSNQWIINFVVSGLAIGSTIIGFFAIWKEKFPLIVVFIALDITLLIMRAMNYTGFTFVKDFLWLDGVFLAVNLGLAVYLAFLLKR